MNSTATTSFQSRYPWLQSYLDYILDDIDLPQLPGHYRGKVRDNYDLPDGRRILVSSDRLSAFDRNIVCVPLKGQVLTQVARFWFEETQDICRNHVVAYPDPNVVVGKRLKMLPVEMVVRDYMAGTTSTSILSLYKKGQRSMYGHMFPDGMRDNQKLPHTIITPTSKAGHGDHDAPLTPTEIVETGLLGESLWQKVSAAALALFARGRELAARRGLILVDTKYEFGLDENGSLVLADEVHTPDSSRYWRAESYAARFAAGEKPESLDKDFIRTWVTARCDPYKDPIPAIPSEIVLEAAAVYVGLYETMTGKAFVPPEKKTSPLERVRENLRAYLGRMA